MSVRGTLLLWVAVGVLGLYVWRTERVARNAGGSDAALEGAAPVAPPLLDVRPDEIDTLEITSVARVLRFRREPAGWRDAAGVPWPHPERLQSLLETLASLRPLYLVDASPVRPADYGLEPPSHRIVVTARGGTQRVLTLGDRNPSWTGVYARAGGGAPVVMIGAVILWEIEKVVRAAS
jgi:hypothetical protein